MVGRKNKYTCNECGEHIITVDVDEGVTPFSIRCRAMPGCDGFMVSSYYRVDQSLEAGWQWLKDQCRNPPEALRLEQIPKVGLGRSLVS